MPRHFDAIVIGSGLGGLIAGALYASSGRRVLVLERNHYFGGAATTYQHGGLTIEASLHEIGDVGEGGLVTAILRAAGALDGVEFVPVVDIFEVRSSLLGEPFVLPRAFGAATTVAQQRFPAHSQAVDEYFRLIRAVREAMTVLEAEHDWLWWLLHTPTLPWRFWPLLRYARSSVAQVMNQMFGEDEAIKMALAANLEHYGDDPESLWFLWYAIAQGSFLASGGYYIRGGSQALSDRLVEAIRKADGVAEAGREVTGILVDDQGRARGVEHEAAGEQGGDRDRQQDFAPVLFGNAAPHVLAEVLPPEMREDFMAPYTNRPLSTSLFSISLGFNRSPREFGVNQYLTVVYPDWMTRLSDARLNASLLADLPGERLPKYVFVNYDAIDAGLNPEGIFLGSIGGIDRLENWRGLSDEEYGDRRERWMDAMIADLERQFPGIASAVVHREMATARTLHRYLNTPGGAAYGFAPLPPAHFPRGAPTAGTRIEGLWLASAYVMGGGYEGAIMGGATAAREAMQYTKRGSRPTPN